MLNKTFKNTLWIISGQIIQMAISFLITMATVRYLGPEKYGILNYTASYLAIISSFCTLGLNSIIVKELVSNRNQQGEILGTCLILRFLSSLISCAAIIIIIYITNNLNFTLVLISILQSVNIIFETTDFINSWFQSDLNSKYVSIVKIFACLLAAIYRIIILILKKNLYWFAFATSIEMIFVSLLLGWTYKRNNGPKLYFSKSLGYELLSKSKHLIISGLMISLYAQMDKVMLGKMIDQTSVGLYSAAVYITNLWSIIPNAIIDSARPSISEAKTHNNQLYLKRLRILYAVIFWLGVLFSIFIQIFGKPILLILYGKNYLPGLNAFKIVSWTSIFAYLGTARSIYIVNENKFKYEKYIALIGCLSNIILNYFFIKSMGIDGAAIATLITQFITNIISQFIIPRMRENGMLILQGIITYHEKF